MVCVFPMCVSGPTLESESTTGREKREELLSCCAFNPTFLDGMMGGKRDELTE